MLNHHAQLIEGSSGYIAPVLDILSKRYELHARHPDLTVRAFEHEKFGVDDAHLIHEILIKKPTQAEWNVVVVYAHTLTEQAQSALLKILEEPPVHTRFMLITDSIHPLLSTLRSRLNLFDLEGYIESVLQIDIKNGISAKSSISIASMQVEKNKLLDTTRFLDADIAERLDIVKKIHGEIDKEKIGIAEVFHFVNEIEKKAHTDITAVFEQNQNEPKVNDGVKGVLNSKGVIARKLNAILKVQTYMHTSGNSVKMLLEYLATTI
jgi:DNA polymerase III delta prime subunit